MSNPRVPFQLSSERPPLMPLDGGHILAHIVVNVEHWPFDRPMPRTLLTPPHGKETVPDVPNFSWAEYGLRCGLPRMIEALRSRGLRASASLNASVIDSHPSAAQAILEAGWEFIGHGVQQQSLAQLDGHAQAEAIVKSLDRIAAFTGVRPRGWLSPGLREAADTPDILAAAGIDHVFDWCLDDLPCWMQTERRSLMALPYMLEVNDSVIYAVEKHSSPEMKLRLERTLEVFAREVARLGQPRVLAIGLHPHLMGVPHRFGDFEAMLDLLLAHPMVRVVTGSSLHDWYAAQVPAPAPLVARSGDVPFVPMPQ